jgi:protein-S-isoprenylcysteine O-methyltransferase Ste14
MDEAEIGMLGHRVIPRSHALAVTGVTLTWAGIALALWARWHLGQYWSARITIKEDHKPIRTGPYARLRHPISTTYACELIWTNHGLWMLASGNRFWNH